MKEWWISKIGIMKKLYLANQEEVVQERSMEEINEILQKYLSTHWGGDSLSESLIFYCITWLQILIYAMYILWNTIIKFLRYITKNIRVLSNVINNKVLYINHPSPLTITYWLIIRMLNYPDFIRLPVEFYNKIVSSNSVMVYSVVEGAPLTISRFQNTSCTGILTWRRPGPVQAVGAPV